MGPKKKVKPGIVEADPNAFSILVHYTEVITEEDGYVSSNNKIKSVSWTCVIRGVYES